MGTGYSSLTDKEKDALRLILRGHDAKSMACELGLSVHTINERLRNARRKLSVTSSKEAARLLLEQEGDAPQFLVGKALGGADRDLSEHDEGTSKAGIPSARVIIGALAMTLVLTVLAVSLVVPASQNAAPTVAEQSQQGEAEAAARSWLEDVDAGEWSATYAATASSFRELNTLETWRNTGQVAQADLGATLTRRLEGVEQPPTPQGYMIIKFRTDFANRAGALETVSLLREDGDWKIAGIFVS